MAENVLRHTGARGLAEVRRARRQAGCVDHAQRVHRMRCGTRSAACSASSTRARCAPRCSARWRPSAPDAELVALRVDQHARVDAAAPAARIRRPRRGYPLPAVRDVRSSSPRTNFQISRSQPAEPYSQRGVPSGPLPMSAPTSGAQRRLSEPRHRLRIGRLDDQSAERSRPLHVSAGRQHERRPPRHRRQMPGQHRLGHQNRGTARGGAQERRAKVDDPADQLRFAHQGAAPVAGETPRTARTPSAGRRPGRRSCARIAASSSP